MRGMSEGQVAQPAGGWPRVLLFGLDNATTARTLQGLLAHDIRPQAVLLPESAAPHLIAGDQPFQVAAPTRASGHVLQSPVAERIVPLAWREGIPVWVIRDLAHDRLIAALTTLGAELGVVACFTRRLPKALLALFPWGVLNVHPSLLPDYRGPAPLFWQFRAGEERFGVTIHQVDEGLDTGDILAQQAIALPVGISGSAASARLTDLGIALLVEQLARLSAGTASPVSQPAGGTYFGQPTEQDFAIPIEWPARRAFTFMRGTMEWGRPYRIDMGDETHYLSEAIAFSESAGDIAMAVEAEDVLALSLAEGTLWARPADAVDVEDLLW